MNANSPALAEPIISLRGVSKVYRTLGGEVTALKDISLTVKAGEYLVVTGKSGSGKTTLVNLISGLDRCTAGEVWVAGDPVHRMTPETAVRWRSVHVGVVFQGFELLQTLSNLHNVMLPMDFSHQYSPAEARQRALHLLEQVDVAEHAFKPPTGISGGQQQRVAIARALANDPPLILADEPTGSLDSATTEMVLGIFERLVEQGKTVVLVTHDRDITRHARRSITLHDGQIVDEKG